MEGGRYLLVCELILSLLEIDEEVYNKIGVKMWTLDNAYRI